MARARLGLLLAFVLALGCRDIPTAAAFRSPLGAVDAAAGDGVFFPADTAPEVAADVPTGLDGVVFDVPVAGEAGGDDAADADASVDANDAKVAADAGGDAWQMELPDAAASDADGGPGPGDGADEPDGDGWQADVPDAAIADADANDGGSDSSPEAWSDTALPFQGVGGPCDTGSPCPNGLQCYGWPNGYCTLSPCGAAKSCQGGSVCWTPPTATPALCAVPCYSVANCPQAVGYGCKRLSAAFGGLDANLCVPVGPSATGMGCKTALDCAGDDTCLTDWSGGYCARLGCSAADPCDGGGACVLRNGVFTCLKSCIADADCAIPSLEFRKCVAKTDVKKISVQVCVGATETCTAPPGTKETCNGKDDDCDGVTDNNLVPSLAPCNQLGVCKQALTATCSGAKWLCAYSGFGYEPKETLCDGKDNDCNSLTDEASSTTTYYEDADGDGYGLAGSDVTACAAPAGYVLVGGDCDDSSSGAAAIHPGATETCNGLDDDCDGLTDEGFGAKVYYQDKDGDGYGNKAVSLSACVKPAGYVTDQSDCDDTKNSVNPGVTSGGLQEALSCNGVDNDCDGYTDNSMAWPWYFDGDGDGFGTPSQSKSVCIGADGGSGWVKDGSDCNDSNAAIHPGVAEITCDGVDQDCVGGDDCTSVCTPMTLFGFENGPQGWTLGSGWTWHAEIDYFTKGNLSSIAYRLAKVGGYAKTAGGASAWTQVNIPNNAKFIELTVTFKNSVDDSSGYEMPDTAAKVTVSLNGSSVQLGPYSTYDGKPHSVKLTVDPSWWKTQVPLSVTVTTPNASTDGSAGYFVDTIRVLCN